MGASIIRNHYVTFKLITHFENVFTSEVSTRRTNTGVSKVNVPIPKRTVYNESTDFRSTAWIIYVSGVYVVQKMIEISSSLGQHDTPYTIHIQRIQ